MAIEIHFEKHINNLNIVRDTDMRYRREYIALTSLFAAFLFCLFFYAWQHYRWISTGYKIEEAQRQKEQLTEMAHQLRVERESLRNLQRIDDIARRNLGMVLPAPGQIVIFNADAPLTIPRPQAPLREDGPEQLAAKR